MQVIEFAHDLGVETGALVHLLREMGISVGDPRTKVTDADVARVLARIERERRAGHKDPASALESAIQEAQPVSKRRRRRRRAVDFKLPEPEPEVDPDEMEAPTGQDDLASGVGATQIEAERESAPEVAPEEEEPLETGAEKEEPAAGDREPAIGVAAEAEQEEPDPPTDAPDGSAVQIKSEKPESVRARFVETPLKSSPAGKPAPAASAGPGGRVRIQAEGYTSDGRRRGRGVKKGKKRKRVDQSAVQSNIQRVMAELRGGGKKRKKSKSTPSRQEREAARAEVRKEQQLEAQTVRVNEYLTVAELAELVDTSALEIVASAFKNLGLPVTINQRLDFDQIELLLEEFGYTAVREAEYGAETDADQADEEDVADLRPRPPVVTVMGHVDHGKTLLLDHIRKTNVVAGEAGGITQHIGAYQVDLEDGRSISFLDTPGHAAFTAMRARGADVTDLVVLVVAADDSVMPQTVEAISHARNAGVPLVVAINKVDLPGADPERVKQELLRRDVTIEDYGGDVLSSEVSAKTGQGIDDLLEKILLQAEVLDLKANPDRLAQGTVIEAKLDIGKGPVVTVLVQKGTLRTGASFVCGFHDGRVRALFDERGKEVESVGPGNPVQILGSSGVPQAGDHLMVMAGDRAAEIANTRRRLEREKQLRIRDRGVKLGDLSMLVSQGEADALPLIIKGDVDGSVQAVADALEQLATDEVKVEIVHRGVGAINESDVLLAETARAVMIGFRVRPDPNARNLAAQRDVEVHLYDVIYEAVDDIRSALEGMLAPERREEILGVAEVREIFRIRGVGTIAGSYIREGRIDRKMKIRLVREGVAVYEGSLGSMKRFKDDVSEVREGFECGLGIANFNDVKVGDLIESYRVEEIARTLAGVSGGGRQR